MADDKTKFTEAEPHQFYLIWAHPDSPGPELQGFAKHQPAMNKWREIEATASWAILYEPKPNSDGKTQNEIMRMKGIP